MIAPHGAGMPEGGDPGRLVVRCAKDASGSGWGRGDLLFHDVRFAVRTLRRQPAFTCGVIVLLAVAIGANVAMFTVFHQALIRPLPYAEPERLVLGRAAFNGFVNPDMSAYDYFDYRERNRVFESVGAIITGPSAVNVTGGDEPEQLTSAFVSWDLFPTLGVPAAAGRYFTPAEGEPGGPDVVMISGGYWLRRFAGAPDAVGSTIRIDGRPETVVGMMPQGFRFLHDADVWFPMRRDGPRADSRGWHNWLMVGRLGRDVTLRQAQADADIISAHLARDYPDTNRDKVLLLTALHAVLAEGFRPAAILLMAAVCLVLLIACGNVASLLLARGMARRTELRVRAALGASPWRMARQLLTESVLLAAAAGLLGIGLAAGAQRALRYFVSAGVPGVRELGFSWPMLAFALLLSAATGLIFGALPAVQAVRTGIVSSDRSGGRAVDVRSQRCHNGLVVAQVAVSVVLLIGSGLLLRSLARLRAVNPGFDTRNLLTTEVRLASDTYADPVRRAEFFSGLMEDLRTVPGVTDVAVANKLPIRDPGYNIAVYASDRPPADPNDRTPAFWRMVSPGYFEAMGIPLLRGRDIKASDTPQAAQALVINETMARTLFPDEDPLGRRVTIGNSTECEVIGVVGDVRVSGFRYEPRLVMYRPFLQQSALTMRLAIRTALEPSAVAKSLRAAIWRRDRDIPVGELARMDEIVARSVASDRVLARAVTLFGAAAALLAAIGLYGLLAYYVSRRTHEIGVRVALGAGTRHILTHVLGRGMVLVGAGIALGLVGAFWCSRLLRQVLFETAPTDGAVFVGASLLFVLVALVACLVPARRALKVDTVSALTVR